MRKRKRMKKKLGCDHTSKKTKCRYCGYEYPQKSGKCPANGKTCTFCSKKTILKQSASQTKQDKSST
jgi:predicted ATP-dependent serine protease